MLEVGDVILVTGAHSGARKLVQAQRVLIAEAKSSHVILARAETLCVDAVPKEGVRQRFLLDALSNIEPAWEVIRLNGITDAQRDEIIKASVYYINQSYLIHPAHYIGKTKSYCSELVRKIYSKAGIAANLPNAGIVMPAHFDQLAASNNGWSVVTPEVRQWVEAVKADELLYRKETDVAINLLKLNRRRFAERRRWRDKFKKLFRQGKISKESLEEKIRILNDVDNNVNYKFWDYE